MTQKIEVTNHHAVEPRRLALQTELDRLVHLLIDRYDPECIILYGSFASGEIHEWSDLDLCVIKRTEIPVMQRLKEVGLLTLSSVGCNVLVYTPEEFDAARQKRHYFVVGEILEKGKVLYQKEGGYAGAVAGVCTSRH